MSMRPSTVVKRHSPVYFQASEPGPGKEVMAPRTPAGDHDSDARAASSPERLAEDWQLPGPAGCADGHDSATNAPAEMRNRRSKGTHGPCGRCGAAQSPLVW